MKKIQILTISAFLALFAIAFTGCATTGGAGSTIDPQVISDSAVILRNAARSVSALAIQDDANNRKYVALAVTALDTFLVGTDYTPGALVKALTPVLSQVKDVKVSLAVNTVTDLYEVFYGRYVKSKIAANQNATLFLTALRDGAAQGLNAASPPTQ